MKRLFSVFAIALLSLALLLAVGAETVTVSGDMTLAKAIDALGGKGGTIVLAEPTSAARGFTLPEQSGDVVITGQPLTVAGNIVLKKNENNNTVTFDMPLIVKSGTVRIFGGFNSVKFTSNFTVTGDVQFFGGVNTMVASAAACTNVYEWYENNKSCVTELPYSITVDGGTFSVFEGGNFRPDATAIIGSIAAPISITINGGTFGKGVSFGADSALQLEQAISVSGMNILADDATLTINGGTFNSPIYVLGYMGQTTTTAENNSQYVNSDRKFYAADGNIAININGGNFNCCEISAAQNAATYSQLLRGDYKVTVKSGATFKSGLVFDATQVKAYEGKTNKAEINYPSSAKISVVRFDTVNGKSVKYKEPERISCVGDSITQGSCAYEGSVVNYEKLSYPAQLLSKMVSLGEDVVLSNYGCGATKVMDFSGLGYTTGLTYKLSMEETDADIIIIGLGTNDAGSTACTYGMSDRFLEEYYAFAKGYATLPDTDMVYCTSAIFRDGTDVPAVSGARALQEIAARTLTAEGEKCTYVDLYALTLDDALLGRLLHSDMLHPHAAGYTIYADRIYDAIRKGITEVKDFEMTDIYVSSRGRQVGKGTKDDPMNNISVAFAKAADEVTVHIIGEYNYTKMNDTSYGFQTPEGIKKITIVGEGEGAKLKMNTSRFFVNSDIVLDNITLEGASSVNIILGYHNATFTETFKCDKAILVAGVETFADDKTSFMYCSKESADSDSDCVININGGDYSNVVGGNITSTNSRDSVFGTYSGNMVINIGKDVTIGSNARNGAVGQNYIAGSVVMNVGAWTNNGKIREYALIGSTNGAKEYDESRNTGSVTVNVLEGVDAKVAVIGDINVDGSVTLTDALLMLRDALDKKTVRNSENYYGITTYTVSNVENVISLTVK